MAPSELGVGIVAEVGASIHPPGLGHQLLGAVAAQDVPVAGQMIDIAAEVATPAPDIMLCGLTTFMAGPHARRTIPLFGVLHETDQMLGQDDALVATLLVSIHGTPPGASEGPYRRHPQQAQEETRTDSALSELGVP